MGQGNSRQVLQPNTGSVRTISKNEAAVLISSLLGNRVVLDPRVLNKPEVVRFAKRIVRVYNQQAGRTPPKQSNTNTEINNIIKALKAAANRKNTPVVQGVPVTATGVPAPASYANILKKYGFSDEYTNWARRTNQPTIRKFINQKNKTVNSQQPNLNKALANLRAKMTYKKYNIKSTTNFNEVLKLRNEMKNVGYSEENLAKKTLQQLRTIKSMKVASENNRTNIDVLRRMTGIAVNGKYPLPLINKLRNAIGRKLKTSSGP